MATMNKLITFEEAATQIGVLSMLFPLPNAKNIPFEYIGFATTPVKYALTMELPWVDYAAPKFY